MLGVCGGFVVFGVVCVWLCMWCVYGEVCMVRVRLCMCGGMSVSDPFVTSRAVARQAPLSMGFPRQEH